MSSQSSLHSGIHPEIESYRLAWLESVQAISTLGAALSDAEWEAPTPCPGWSRKDLISHLVGIESRVLGGEIPDPATVDVSKPWVKSSFAGFMEIDVEVRRARRGEIVFGEFVDITHLRNEAWELDERTPESTLHFEPFGEITLDLLLRRRVMDIWTHNQDLRTSLNISGDERGLGAMHSWKELGAALPMVFGKRAGATPGQSLSLEVRDCFTSLVQINDDGKGAFVKELAAPTTSISMSAHEWYLFAAGRDGREQAAPLITGDADLAERVLKNFATTP